MIYQFREGSRFSVKPQVAGEALEAIREANGGNLCPSDVVEASEPADAPLHNCFEWDQSRAARLYQEEQARNLIRSVVISSDEADRPETAIAYVHVQTEDGPCYLPSAVVMSDEVLRNQAIGDALRLLHGVQKRYSDLSELRGVFREIEKAEERVRKAKVRQRQVAASA